MFYFYYYFWIHPAINQFCLDYFNQILQNWVKILTNWFSIIFICHINHDGVKVFLTMCLDYTLQNNKKFNQKSDHWSHWFKRLITDQSFIFSNFIFFNIKFSIEDKSTSRNLRLGILNDGNRNFSFISCN